MTTELPELAAPTALLALMPTAAGALAAFVAHRADGAVTAWRAARAATWVTLATAIGLGVALAVTQSSADVLVRVDPITVVVLGLVGLVGWVVVRFSSRYLAGDPFEVRAASRLAATLASVAAVVVSNNLVTLGLAWAATSLSLHGLLTHVRDRPVAVAVAHKKFVLARVADACMLGAVVVFALGSGTTRIDELAAGAVADGTLSLASHLGVLLVAVAVVLKCAQLPFHGWLIQVMEAPTPVSALLHAGVVNLGGVVLLRLAPMVDRAPAAQALLVAVGGVTAVVASLVMTTRISVKVSLAWSTCAQMGIMLVQCGLGLWELALLHLVAHSLYKAHAFLRAGSTVRTTMRHRLVRHPRRPARHEIVAGLTVAVGVSAVAVAGWTSLSWSTPLGAAGWVFIGVVALAVTSLGIGFVQHPTARLAGRIVALPLLALVLHDLAYRIVPHGPTPPVGLVVLAATLLAGLFAAQTLMTVAPTAPIVVRAHAWLFRGLFLDEAFTRVVFSVWPPPATTPRPAPLPRPAATATVPVARTAAVR